MTHVVAEGREITLVSGGTSAGYRTTPIEIGPFDRASGLLVVHDISGGNVATDRDFSYVTEVSIDGVNWVQQGPSVSSIDQVSDTPRMDAGNVNGRLLRVSYGYAIGAGSGGSVVFTLTIRLFRES